MQTTSNTRHQQNLLLILMIVNKLKLIDICIFVENESYAFVQLSRKMLIFEISAPSNKTPLLNSFLQISPLGLIEDLRYRVTGDPGAIMATQESKRRL